MMNSSKTKKYPLQKSIPHCVHWNYKYSRLWRLGVHGKQKQYIMWKEWFCFKAKTKPFWNRKWLGLKNWTKAQLLGEQLKKRRICCHILGGDGEVGDSHSWYGAGGGSELPNTIQHRLPSIPLAQGYQIHFHRGHISLSVAFKGPKVISAP